MTLPGVRVVIDSGLAREPRYDPNSGFARLDTVAIAQASADQRAGRAGRVASGWAYRLWPQSQRLEPQRRPEIAQVELAGLALELAAWGSDAVRFVDAPPPVRWRRRATCCNGWVRSTRSLAITALGRRMLALGTHPRLAAMLLASHDAGEQALACDLAALLEARDPLSPGGAQRCAGRSLAGAGGFATWTQCRRDAHRAALAAIDAAAQQWRRRLRIDAHAGGATRRASARRCADACVSRSHRAPASAATRAATSWPTAAWRACSMTAPSVWRTVDRRQRIARCRAMPGAARRAARRSAAAARFAATSSRSDVVRWDADATRAGRQRERRFAAIVLDSRAGRPRRPAQAHARSPMPCARWAWRRCRGRARWSNGARASARCAQWMPEAGVCPTCRDAALLATLDDWLQPAFAGKTRLDALDAARFGAALDDAVDWSSRSARPAGTDAHHGAVGHGSRACTTRSMPMTASRSRRCWR